MLDESPDPCLRCPVSPGMNRAPGRQGGNNKQAAEIINGQAADDRQWLESGWARGRRRRARRHRVSTSRTPATLAQTTTPGPDPRSRLGSATTVSHRARAQRASAWPVRPLLLATPSDQARGRRHLGRRARRHSEGRGRGEREEKERRERGGRLSGAGRWWTAASDIIHGAVGE